MNPQFRLRQVDLIIPNDCVAVRIGMSLQKNPLILQSSKRLLAEQRAAIVNANLSRGKSNLQLLARQWKHRPHRRICHLRLHLIQSRQRFESLRFPHSSQVPLVLSRPIADQSLRPAWQVSLDHFQRIDLKNTAVFAVNRVEMRHPMLSKIHPDRNSVKSSDYWHMWHLASSP